LERRGLLFSPQRTNQLNSVSWDKKWQRILNGIYLTKLDNEGIFISSVAFRSAVPLDPQYLFEEMKDVKTNAQWG
jgi:hypothetical protein